jgi:hypothetical protein
VKQKSETIDDNNYVIREDRNATVTYWKHGNVEGKGKGCIISIVGNVNGTATYLFVRCFCKLFT